MSEVVSMYILALLNFVLGALLARRFNVMILVPCTALAVLETVLFNAKTISTISVIWHGAILVVAFQLGFLLSSLLGSYVTQRLGYYSPADPAPAPSASSN